MSKTATLTVKVGQTWQSNDVRGTGAPGDPEYRQPPFKVLEIEGDKAVVSSASSGSRKRRIALANFKGGKRGYSLIKDV